MKADLLANSSKLESYRIDADQLNEIVPYTVFGFDIFHIGWIKADYGAKVGVPEYFNHHDGDFQTYGIMVSTEYI